MAARRVYRGNARRLMHSVVKLNDSLILIDTKRNTKGLPTCLSTGDATQLGIIAANILARINNTM